MWMKQVAPFTKAVTVIHIYYSPGERLLVVTMEYVLFNQISDQQVLVASVRGETGNLYFVDSFRVVERHLYNLPFFFYCPFKGSVLTLCLFMFNARIHDKDFLRMTIDLIIANYNF